jgi:hypothetical protein
MRALQVTFNIQGPTTINSMFTDWLLVLGQKQLLVEAAALCWFSWKCRDDLIFHKASLITYM